MVFTETVLTVCCNPQSVYCVLRRTFDFEEAKVGCRQHQVNISFSNLVNFKCVLLVWPLHTCPSTKQQALRSSATYSIQYLHLESERRLCCRRSVKVKHIIVDSVCLWTSVKIQCNLCLCFFFFFFPSWCSRACVPVPRHTDWLCFCPSLCTSVEGRKMKEKKIGIKKNLLYICLFVCPVQHQGWEPNFPPTVALQWLFVLSPYIRSGGNCTRMIYVDWSVKIILQCRNTLF